MNQNKSITDYRGNSIRFQDQNIKTGSFLYCFTYCAVVQVLALVDCGSGFCVEYGFKRAKMVNELTSANFCTVPTLEEAEQEEEKIEFDIKSGKPYQIFELYKGTPNENPLYDNLLALNYALSMVRTASIASIDADGFTVNSRFIIAKFKNGTAKTKIVVGLGSWLHIFFEQRAKVKSANRTKVLSNKTKDINIKKAIAFLLKNTYNSQSIQRYESLSFPEWVRSLNLT